MKLLKDFTHLSQNAWVNVIVAQVEGIVAQELVVGFQVLAHGVLRISFLASLQSQHGHQDHALKRQMLHHGDITCEQSLHDILQFHLVAILAESVQESFRFPAHLGFRWVLGFQSGLMLEEIGQFNRVHSFHEGLLGVGRRKHLVWLAEL